jgi:hypothetical protein
LFSLQTQSPETLRRKSPHSNLHHGFLAAAMRVSPLHMLSLALGFVALRLLAACNNMLIHFYGIAPIGAPIKMIARHTPSVFAFAILLVPLFYLLAIGVSPIAAKILSFWRRQLA